MRTERDEASSLDCDGLHTVCLQKQEARSELCGWLMAAHETRLRTISGKSVDHHESVDEMEIWGRIHKGGRFNVLIRGNIFLKLCSLIHKRLHILSFALKAALLRYFIMSGS